MGRLWLVRTGPLDSCTRVRDQRRSRIRRHPPEKRNRSNPMSPLLHIDPDDPYPESDGQPMADNTEQYGCIVKIKENLEILFADRARQADARAEQARAPIVWPSGCVPRESTPTAGRIKCVRAFASRRGDPRPTERPCPQRRGPIRLPGRPRAAFPSAAPTPVVPGSARLRRIVRRGSRSSCPLGRRAAGSRTGCRTAFRLSGSYAA